MDVKNHCNNFEKNLLYENNYSNFSKKIYYIKNLKKPL